LGLAGRLVTVPLVLVSLSPIGVCSGAGLEAGGNTDGVLTFSLGDLAPGGTVRPRAIFAFDTSYEGVAQRLDAARRSSLEGASDGAGTPVSLDKVWVDNGVTDFALEGPGYFRWRMERQALRCAQGGQLSQFTWYVHYTDGTIRKRAGIANDGDDPPENLRTTGPLLRYGERAVSRAMETSDSLLSIGVRAVLRNDTGAVVEFALTSRAATALTDVRLSLYANIEANHDEGDDISVLDAASGALLVVDVDSGVHVAMAGLEPPESGFAGTWNSIGHAAGADGVPFGEWAPYTGPSPELVARTQRERLASQGIYLPYTTENPTTPETRQLAPDGAAALLEADWLRQAEGQPPADRALREIEWANALAARLATDPRGCDLSPELVRLADLKARILEVSAAGWDEATAKALYLAVRRTKRRIALSNPAVDFTQLLFIDQPYPRGPVNDIHEAIHRMGITATPGGRLLVLDGLDPGGAARQLAPDRPGSFWRPDLSFDAQRVLFCYKACDSKSFHLYEMNLDGTGLRELTSSDYDDIDPVYLPDGHVMFTTTRANSYVRCGPFIYSYTLARCDADGGNVYLISQNGEPDFVPALMEDGRVIYSRWEYTDKPLWRVQSLWTTDQDGTGTRVFWGNQSVWPDHTAEPRQIPGSHRVMFCGVGHHDWWSGSIGIIDPWQGSNFPQGLTKVTMDRPWPECSAPPVDPAESATYHASGTVTGYQSPYPLNEHDFLVSARPADGKFRLYLMDTEGNRELVYEGVHNVLHAIPVRPRKVPAIQPDLVAWPGTGADRKPNEPGYFYSSDVYEGVPDLPRGSAKYLRVFQQDHKTYSTWAKTFRHSGPPVSIVQEESVKRIVSVVPVADDGSVSFEAPAGKALFLQLLDEDQRCLQTMRSFTGVLPGERRGCVGCHEAHTRSPAVRTGEALHRDPTPVSPPPWGPESISYERFAQPVLDRYCGRCHQGEGEARKVLDLTFRPGMSVFSEPYLTLVGGAGWSTSAMAGQPGYGIAGAIPVETMDLSMNGPQAYRTLRPMEYLSRTSPLIQLAMSGEHHEVRVDPLSLQRLIAWVDACCPYMGEEELRAIPDPDFEGIEMLPIRPRVATAPVVERP